jgi:hypothetical protein
MASKPKTPKSTPDADPLKGAAPDSDIVKDYGGGGGSAAKEPDDD